MFLLLVQDLRERNAPKVYEFPALLAMAKRLAKGVGSENKSEETKNADQEQERAESPCIFGCGCLRPLRPTSPPAPQDDLTHYLRCPVLWRIVASTCPGLPTSAPPPSVYRAVLMPDFF